MKNDLRLEKEIRKSGFFYHKRAWLEAHSVMTDDGNYLYDVDGKKVVWVKDIVKFIIRAQLDVPMQIASKKHVGQKIQHKEFNMIFSRAEDNKILMEIDFTTYAMPDLFERFGEYSYRVGKLISQKEFKKIMKNGVIYTSKDLEKLAAQHHKELQELKNALKANIIKSCAAGYEV